jgi:hypothetical protein
MSLKFVFIAALVLIKLKWIRELELVKIRPIFVNYYSCCYCNVCFFHYFTLILFRRVVYAKTTDFQNSFVNNITQQRDGHLDASSGHLRTM